VQPDAITLWNKPRGWLTLAFDRAQGDPEPVEGSAQSRDSARSPDASVGCGPAVSAVALPAK
jgi:hypothetical protein